MLICHYICCMWSNQVREFKFQYIIFKRKEIMYVSPYHLNHECDKTEHVIQEQQSL